MDVLNVLNPSNIFFVCKVFHVEIIGSRLKALRIHNLDSLHSEDGTQSDSIFLSYWLAQEYKLFVNKLYIFIYKAKTFDFHTMTLQSNDVM